MNTTKPTALTDEYKEGLAAYNEGKSMWANPYAADPQSSDWHSGWWAGMEEKAFWAAVK